MIIDGNLHARQLLERLHKSTAILLKKGIQPGVGIMLVGDNPASRLYVSMKLRVARELGYHVVRVHLEQDASEDEVMKKLRQLQADQRIHGVIVQIPLPAHLDRSRICSIIDLRKDIDCLNPKNLQKLFGGKKPFFWPPTAESVVALIQSSKTPIKKKKIIIIGRGFFAQQIAALCAVRGARVVSISSSTTQKKAVLRSADIIISAVGKPGIVTGDLIKKGAIVIDVGTTKVGAKTVGDVDMKTVVMKARAVSPVPGGVGPMTVAMLMKNVLMATLALTKAR